MRGAAPTDIWLYILQQQTLQSIADAPEGVVLDV